MNDVATVKLMTRPSCKSASVVCMKIAKRDKRHATTIHAKERRWAALPPAAMVGLKPDRTTDVSAVLRSAMRRPGQWLDVMRVAADARIARRALLRGRRLLGAGLAFPDFRELELDVA